MGADIERSFYGPVARGREVDRPENASRSQYAPVYLTCARAFSAAQRCAHRRLPEPWRVRFG
jgi:hypothetical protein